MEAVNNLDLILKKQDESVKRDETDRAVEAAISKEKEEIERRIKNWRCSSCGRGVGFCNCRLIVEARGARSPHGRKVARKPKQVSSRSAARRKDRRKMQKRSRRINRAR